SVPPARPVARLRSPLRAVVVAAVSVTAPPPHRVREARVARRRPRRSPAAPVRRATTAPGAAAPAARRAVGALAPGASTAPAAVPTGATPPTGPAVVASTSWVAVVAAGTSAARRAATRL